MLDKYEYRVKTEQMLEYMEKKQYKKAMEIADTIDWRRVKSVSMLNTVSEIYELNGEFQKSRDILFVAFDRSPGSRKIVYRLGTLALKIDDTDEASDCYEEFVKLAPKDPNQYILKYKILKAQGAPLEDQIAALEDFKKGEYVEKWAYELAKLYHEAGMTAECLEECDDLILWFSEGKYVYQAMELKMKYKPLTPMQQEKYNNSPAGKQKARAMQLQKEKEEEKAAYQQKALKAKAAAEAARAARMAAQAAEEEEPEEAEDDLEESGDVSEEMEVPNNVIEEVAETISEEMDEDSFEEGEMLPEESEEVDEEEPKEEDTMKQSSITKVVKGATLQEALANGVALASGRSLNIEEKAMKEKDEALRVTGQMRIEDILQEWEAKQKQNAEAIEQQKQKDVERIQKEREEAERRREEERLEIERKAAEAEAARKAAEEEAARKAAEEEAARKAAEEEAARKAAEEEAARKAAEEEAARKAAIEEAAKLAGEEDVAAAGLGETRRIPDDIVKLMEEMGLQEKEEAEDEPEELSLEDALAAHGAEEIIGEMDEEAFEEADYEEGDYEEADFEEEDFEEADYEEADFEEEEFEEAAAEEADFEEEDFEEADYEEADFEEEDFEETDYEEADYEDDFEADFGEEVEADFEDDLEADFEDDFEADFEDDFEEADYEEDDFFDEEAEEEDEETDFEEEELEIEEPSEEEIQARIKKSKGSGVPFDTGFVVTGRYDLSATSEIGLKAGLTEEQKKLFSYFVPVRGMSEQIVEVLDNDRRAQREGTSKTGNLMVIGRKGSGKTVLAVDIVKAIQKQRNLKQGKVAIVTGESLNKKELTNIIQKLRGGAIIIEKAGKLNSRTIKELNYLMEKKTGELLFVLEDQRKPLERLLTANPDFRKKFTSKLELPVFINDELVTFGQTYAKENGYKLDEMGILALYSRIDVMQREDHAVTVAEVKEIMDEAIAHSQKANVKHLARRVFGKSTDDSDRIILKEEDFKI